MGELLINAVAATVKMYNLKIVSFLMCVDVAGRLPGNFADVWPQMQVSLGGEGLAKICHFVVTKANGDSKVNKAKLAKLPNEEFYKELVYSPMKWPVIHAGRENLDGLQKVMQPTSTKAVGIGGESVDPDAQSLATKKKIASELEQKILTLRNQQENESRNTGAFADSLSRMAEEINNAYEKLASLGNCKDAEKRRLRSLIDTKKSELREMEDIRKMHGLGAFFKNLVGGVVDAAVGAGEDVMPRSREVHIHIGF